jgi:hypothetical protein
MSSVECEIDQGWNLDGALVEGTRSGTICESVNLFVIEVGRNGPCDTDRWRVDNSRLDTQPLSCFCDRNVYLTAT